MRRDFFDYAGAEAIAMACGGQHKALERLRLRRRARHARRRAGRAEHGDPLAKEHPAVAGRGTLKGDRQRGGDRWFAPAVIALAALGWVGWGAALAAEQQLGKELSLDAVLMTTVLPACLSVGALLLVALATPRRD